MFTQQFSYLKSINADYIDELFDRWSKDPDIVDASWRYFFEGVDFGIATQGHPADAEAADSAPGALDWGSELKVHELIQAYREKGKLLADLNPLRAPPSSHPELELSRFGLGQADLSRSFASGKLIGLAGARLSEILARLKSVYCGTIAVELGHIQDPVARQWLQSRVESGIGPGAAPDVETRRFILRRLTESEGFERFLHTRYVAQKRFSVEGGESVIPVLDCMIETGAELGAREIVIGMAHRGRLNVLVNLMGKKPETMFTEFEGTYKADLSHGEGDVKYHKGYSRDFLTRHGKPIHLSLTANPSHLEFVNPVVEGITRAKQDRLSDADGSQAIPILIHGDAAFAGQGVCYETLQAARLPGYRTGGTLHVVINNQVGFTADDIDARSTLYCTDLAKMLDAPIFHVNGDDPEAVWFLSRLCTEYRQKFKSDAFIDLICYRKHGHNEGDEPSFTQPLMYRKIKSHASTRELYAQKLAQAGIVPASFGQELVDQTTQALIEAQKITKAQAPYAETSVFGGVWKGFKQPHGEELFAPAATSVSEKTIRAIAEKINHVPDGFQLHPKLTRFFEARLKAVQDGKGIDWGNAEALAFATLLAEGHDVRLTGQDAERGTFTHRHSVLHDYETGEQYMPFNQLGGGKQGKYTVHNSFLSETAVLGFEYGYSLAAPQALVIWEAQFGDFANGAQVIIDQFISTGESKWQRMSALTLLLPHGYEGQGPEHSSARLERFLQLCGRDNMSVCNLTTPAQLFHGLRRQLKRDFRKPLVIMSPKSLLRHPQAISTSAELSQGSFEEAIDDRELASETDAKAVTRVLLCSGKIYYDLVNERTARKRPDVAIVRVEQLYPWPAVRLAAILARYPAAKELIWTQEEPRNMGAWNYVFSLWNGGLGDPFITQAGSRPLRYAGREIASAPAVGSPKIHEAQFKALIEAAFAG